MIWIGLSIIIGSMIIGGCVLNVADAILGENYHEKDSNQRVQKRKENKTKVSQ